MKNSRRKNYKMKIRAILLTALAILICLLAFVGCDEEESTLYADNGLEYVVNSDGVTCTIVGIGKCTDTVITVPESIRDYWVTAIGKEAFCPGRYETFPDITEIILPEGLETIGDSAFEMCENLTKINLPDTVTSIGMKAFERCSALEEISFPEGIDEIKVHTFMGCTSLKSFAIPESVEIIGASAFLGCSSLESITVPNGVIDIGESAFMLSGIKIANIGSGVTTIGMMAFMQCENLTDVYYSGTLAEWEEVFVAGTVFSGEETFHCEGAKFPTSDFSD